MRIYVDFDDVICETAISLSYLADSLYGRKVPYNQIHHFNLKMSFSLNQEQYENLIETAHQPDFLATLEETPGAITTLNKWLNDGHQVEVMTGRPFNTYEASRLWLDTHGLPNLPLFHVDKYGREKDLALLGDNNGLALEDFLKLKYDFAVEDAPHAFQHLEKIPNCKVAVFSRPWNLLTPMPTPLFTRCKDWQEIDSLLG